MKFILFLLILFFKIFLLEAQQVLSEEDLSKKPMYSNFARAYQKSEEVYKITLKSGSSIYGKIDGLPIDIDTLKNLQFIQVINEKLQNLPPRFAKLQYMQQIYMSGNKFPVIPPAIYVLKNLKRLDLQKNEISIIVNDIDKLENLEYLYLNDNPLVFLSVEHFRKLKKLKFLNIKNTKLPEPIIKDLKKYLTWVKIDVNY
ncbi:MAG: leucine-rich repeat domain-containing protein [Bacteroidetes bacterium]|nr:MAG: leucine-rich repeat domain-containing protein [Bacteroidota bacterium]TAG89062.1 MAG: leucine-rich repeat domain-containing protein [Bacteroidota bacterium]